jgi:hypothetical protein
MTERRLARALRPGAQKPQQPWRPKIKLTTRERKLVARVRKRRTKTHKNIVALIARDLRLAVDDPCVNEEVECACRTWEALAADPEPRTPLQRLLAARSNLLVAEREVLRAAARRQIEDNDESFYC